VLQFEILSVDYTGYCCRKILLLALTHRLLPVCLCISMLPWI